MNILITGHRGFLGRAFTRQLNSEGHNVAGVDIKPWAHGDPLTVQGHTLDIRSFCSSMSTYAQRVQYDMIIHLAENEADGAASKMEVDAAFWEWVVRTKQKRVLYVSSGEVYPLRRDFDVSEADISYPETLSGWVKFMGEKLACDAAAAGCRVTVCRLFDVYGEGASRYIGRLIRNYLMPSPMAIIVENELLNLLHVNDAILAMLECERSTKLGFEIFNVGGQNISTLELIDLLRRGMEPVEVLWAGGDKSFVRHRSPELVKLDGVFRRNSELGTANWG